MAWSTLAAPGKVLDGEEVGPCVLPCTHRGCATTRALAAVVCRLCGGPIGYETRFYLDPQFEEGFAPFAHLVHARCIDH